MSNFKIIIDGKSFLLGMAVCVCFLFFSAFKPATHDCNSGKYQAILAENGKIILNTETGEFVSNGYYNKFYSYHFNDFGPKPPPTPKPIKEGKKKK